MASRTATLSVRERVILKPSWCQPFAVMHLRVGDRHSRKAMNGYLFASWLFPGWVLEVARYGWRWWRVQVWQRA